MSFFRFSNLCSAPFTGGEVVFTPSGDSLLIPAGNRVTVYGLLDGRCLALPVECDFDVSRIAVSPDGLVLILVDESGKLYVVNAVTASILHRFNVGDPVRAVRFSPCGKFLALGAKRTLYVYKTPTVRTGWLLSLHRKISTHCAGISHVAWSPDSRFVATASDDMSVKLMSVDAVPGFQPVVFANHRYPVVGAFFMADQQRLVSIASNGKVFVWRWHKTDDPPEGEARAGFVDLPPSMRKEKRPKVKEEPVSDAEDEGVTERLPEASFCGGCWSVETSSQLNTGSFSSVTRASFHCGSGLLVLGFSNGSFMLAETPSLDTVASLSIERSAVDAIAINSTGEWLAVACQELRQVVVWEWKSESYILKHQSHHFGVRCVAFSPSSALRTEGGKADFAGDRSIGLASRGIIATGGYDGKVKLWTSENGSCFVTFAEHSSDVTDLAFAPQGNAVFSASLDGTVRGHDLLRYRNFRTFSSADGGAQFGSVAVDGSGSIVVASSTSGGFCAYAWNIQTGMLLDVLRGHEDAVTAVAFDPHPSRPGVLVTASLDKTLRVWDLFANATKGGVGERLEHTTDVVDASFDPRGNGKLASAQLSGTITFWDTINAEVLGTIEGIRDIQSGRPQRQKFSSFRRRGIANLNQHFTSICYATNGQRLLAASKYSPRICVYDTNSFCLVQSVILTRNRSLDGVFSMKNSRNMTEIGVPWEEFDLSDEERPFNPDAKRKARQQTINSDRTMPGAREGEMACNKKQLHVWRVRFAPDSRQWSAATSHGLFIFEADAAGQGFGALQSHTAAIQVERFAPHLLTKNVNVQNIRAAMEDKDYSKALILALALNELPVLEEVYAVVPYKRVAPAVQSVPAFLVPALLWFLRVCLSPSRSRLSVHLQFNLWWLLCCITEHLAVLQNWRPSALTGNGEVDHRVALLSQCRSHRDIRSLLLMILREIQRTHTGLSRTFASNRKTLQFIITRRKQQCAAS